MPGTLKLTIDGQTVPVRWGGEAPPTEQDVEDIGNEWRKTHSQQGRIPAPATDLLKSLVPGAGVLDAVTPRTKPGRGSALAGASATATGGPQPQQPAFAQPHPAPTFEDQIAQPKLNTGPTPPPRTLAQRIGLPKQYATPTIGLKDEPPHMSPDTLPFEPGALAIALINGRDVIMKHGGKLPLTHALAQWKSTGLPDPDPQKLLDDPNFYYSQYGTKPVGGTFQKPYRTALEEDPKFRSRMEQMSIVGQGLEEAADFASYFIPVIGEARFYADSADAIMREDPSGLLALLPVGLGKLAEKVGAGRMLAALKSSPENFEKALKDLDLTTNQQAAMRDAYKAAKTPQAELPMGLPSSASAPASSTVAPKWKKGKNFAMDGRWHLTVDGVEHEVFYDKGSMEGSSGWYDAKTNTRIVMGNKDELIARLREKQAPKPGAKKSPRQKLADEQFSAAVKRQTPQEPVKLVEGTAGQPVKPETDPFDAINKPITREEAQAKLEASRAAAAKLTPGQAPAPKARSRRSGAASRNFFPGGGVGPKELAQMQDHGRLLVESGIRGFKEFAANMKEDFKAFGKYLNKKAVIALYEHAHENATDSVSVFARALSDTSATREAWEGVKHEGRGEQAKRLAEAQTKEGDITVDELKAMKTGAFAKPTFDPIRDKIAPGAIDQLHTMITKSAILRQFDKVKARSGLNKALDGHLPDPYEVNQMQKVFGPDAVKHLIARQTGVEKGMGWLLNYERFNRLSSPHTLLKIASTGAESGLGEGIVDLAGPAARKLSGLKGSTEGELTSMSILWKGAKEFTKSIGDEKYWKIMKTGVNSLGEKYGAKGEGDWGGSGWLNIFGNLHTMVMTPFQRGSFKISLEKGLALAEKEHLVPTPHLVADLEAGAYERSLQAVYRNDNVLNKWWQDNVLGGLRRQGPVGRVAAKGLQLGNPIVQVPLNIAGRTGEYVAGIPYGMLKQAVNTSLKTLTPEAKSAILRAYKRGGVGAGVMAIGYFAPDVWKHMPAALAHAPIMQAGKVGATIRESDDALDAVSKLGTMLERDIPLINNQIEAGKVLAKGEMGRASGQFATGFMPASAMTGYIASIGDVPRTPKGFGDELRMQLPGFRQDVEPSKHGQGGDTPSPEQVKERADYIAKHPSEKAATKSTEGMTRDPWPPHHMIDPVTAELHSRGLTSSGSKPKRGSRSNMKLR